MSYDVRLVHPETGDTLPASERVFGGGTYPVGGRDDCCFNITYNYSQIFGPLVHHLNDRTAADTLPALLAFVDMWPDARPYERDYWAPTPGNAKKAVEQLIVFARVHPNGVWVVS